MRSTHDLLVTLSLALPIGLLACGGADLAGPITGSLQVTTATAGVDPDADGYTLVLDGTEHGRIGVTGTVTLTQLTPGSHAVGLSGIAANCEVRADTPGSVTVTAGETAALSFGVTCLAPPPTTGTLHVTTTTTGTSLDADGYHLIQGSGSTLPLGANDSLVISGLTAGEQVEVALIDVADNCAVQGSNPQIFIFAAGEQATAAFSVLCRTPVPASWTPLASGTTWTLSRVSGSSSSNIFVAGNGDGADYGQMTILHSDGTSWSSQLTRAGVVYDVWAASSSDAFALVSAIFPSPFLHYDGTAWTSQAAPGIDLGTEGFLAGLWGFSGRDVFAAGVWSDGNDPRPLIAHYDGVAWSLMPLPNVERLTLTGIWGSSPSDVYAVGTAAFPDGFDRGAVLHYDGHHWVTVLGPEQHVRFAGVWGSSPSDVYVVGRSGVPGETGNEDGGPGTLRHFDGTAWSVLPSPTSSPLQSVWASSPADVYVVAGTGTIWHFAGGEWTPSSAGADGLLDIWGSSANDIYAVGVNGTILHGP